MINPKHFGKVAILYGGTSSERDVSLTSGEAVYQALITANVDAYLIDAKDDFCQPLKQGQFDRVFNILHGGNGENGHVQAQLDQLEIPYTGSGMTACAIAMEKQHCKRIWLYEGIPTPPFMPVESVSQADAIIDSLGLPLAIKPSAEGSSFGVSKVTCKSQFAKAFELAKQYEGEVIAEAWIEGRELTVPIIGNTAYPSVEIKTSRDFYDYEAKYLSNTTQYICPTSLTDTQEAKIRTLSLKAFQVLGAKDWGRIDIMMRPTGELYVLEFNPLPGMTPRSLLPMSAEQVGLSFSAVVLQILSMTLPISARQFSNVDP